MRSARHAEPVRPRPVEPLGPLEHGRIATIAHVRDDRRRDGDRVVEPGSSHGTSRSIGRTRIDVAPASRSAGSKRPHVIGSDGGVHGDRPLVGQLEHRRRAHAREHVANRGQRLGRRVHHHVAPASCRDDAGEHQLEPLDEVVLLLDRAAAADQDRLGGEQRADQPQAVGARGRAGRDEIDDRVGEPEARRRLDRAGDGDELGRDAALVEQHLRRDGIRRRDPEAVEIGDRGLRGIVRDRSLQRAAREPELGERDDVGIRLDDEVRPRHAEVDDAVLDVLGNVARAHEQEVDGSVGARHHERALGRLEREPGIGAQPQRRLGHPALGRDGQREAAVLAGPRERAHRRFARSRAIR